MSQPDTLPTTPLVLIRHGPTAWNAEGRIQGRSDQPLSDEGRARVGAWRLPPELAGYRWVSSPLGRARETAGLLGHADVAVAPALMETAWGEWEGRRLEALRAEQGEALRRMEARGLDFQPPGGESPRQVQDRLRPWLRDLAAEGRPTVAVCHKGVIRALYALATGWDMRADPPEKLRDGCAHGFLVGPGGRVALDRINRPLDP
jgi:probable phosphoglycerate mutase